ncbi:AAEL017004-PA [Aedes aegypti]|uniref:ubiquitinyl hydrolase 1 n=1 Tax=Aedes aegypti TaxID=7159 RepID=J9HYY6_AEDAE|nr:AAEL017004-PA [Aedes aegypti]
MSKLVKNPNGHCKLCTNKDSMDNMVECDDCDRWYHLSCAKLDRSPTAEESWICEHCADIQRKWYKQGAAAIEKKIATQKQTENKSPNSNEQILQELTNAITNNSSSKSTLDRSFPNWGKRRTIDEEEAKAIRDKTPQNKRVKTNSSNSLGKIMLATTTLLSIANAINIKPIEEDGLIFDHEGTCLLKRGSWKTNIYTGISPAQDINFIDHVHQNLTIALKEMERQTKDQTIHQLATSIGHQCDDAIQEIQQITRKRRSKGIFGFLKDIFFGGDDIDEAVEAMRIQEDNKIHHVSETVQKGANVSQLERDIGADQFPPNEHYFGLVNFGNTCYSNSVLQALYFCRPFREKVLEYKAKNKRTKETLLTCLADLFYSIATQKKKVGSIAPKKFIARLRKEKEEFDNYMQQDAHEFLNFLINHINEIILAERNQAKGAGTSGSKNAGTIGGGGGSLNGDNPGQPQEPTWVHEIFQGILTSETRCLNCETVSSKDENFFDLQVDVDQNTSITHCLRCFSNTETLCSDNKFKCDNCCSYQEAQKRMRVKKLPMILALHLKRFKYMEQYNRHIKVSHRVVFPLELRLFNTSDDAVNPDRLYDLMAVVIHCGSGPNRGHYISIVKSHGFWLLFDDDMVDKIEASTIEDFYGLTSDIQKSSETGYILFYQSRDAT